MTDQYSSLQWYKILNSKKDLPENRVVVVSVDNHDICLTHFQGKINALTNKCPHQEGPLGEGSIENGWLRCPWHGWDFHPVDGSSPGGFDDSLPHYPVEEREDGVYIGIEPAKPHQRNISDVVSETLINWGIDTVFGMVGHSNLGLADAFRRQEAKGSLKYIGIRHEGAGAFAASAYGKLTGKPAACFAIAGPGSTNMYTGMWDAKVDRAPLLALTGQVDTQVLGTGNFQELDLVNAFSEVAEFNHRMQNNSNHAELTSLAVKHAILKRDVSHLTFPDEVQTLPVDKEEPAATSEGRMPIQRIAPDEKSIGEAVDKISQSRRPVIIVGHGARFNMEAITEFAEIMNAPVLTTFKGKGLIPDNHPLGCGVLGRSGTPIASWFMNESDLLIVFGASFSNHTGITPKKPIIQVDFDPLALAKFHKIDVPVWGEISLTLKIFKDRLSGKINTENQRPDIQKRWDIWLNEKQRRLKDESPKGLSSIAVFDAMNRLVPEDAVMCVDVGNNAYSFGRYFESRRHSFIMSGYLGSIGFAFPASLGAWAAVENSRPVIAVAGDGGFGQYMAELNTAVLHNMPIKLILLNNSELGKISKEQRSGGFGVWKTEMSNPNFADYAKSCGARGIRVTNRDDLENSMRDILKYDGPAVLEIVTDVKLV